MKFLAAFTLLLSLQTPRFSAPAQLPASPTAAAHPHGKWYLAETGHAVYCYGPVQIVNDPILGIQRVATFCKGDKAVVPLKD